MVSASMSLHNEVPEPLFGTWIENRIFHLEHGRPNLLWQSVTSVFFRGPHVKKITVSPIFQNLMVGQLVKIFPIIVGPKSTVQRLKWPSNEKFWEFTHYVFYVCHQCFINFSPSWGKIVHVWNCGIHIKDLLSVSQKTVMKTDDAL